MKEESDMREETEAICRHYNADPQKEWDRLQTKHPYEKYITVSMMDRYIRPGSTILDIGGGPGHYSVHYARQGHAVTLLDLSDENVRFAKKESASIWREDHCAAGKRAGSVPFCGQFL